MITFKFNNEIILFDEKIVKLSGLLTSMFDEYEEYEEENVIEFNNDKFSYIVYKDTISLCEKYLTLGKISEDVNVSILECLNYLGCEDVLDSACKYLASQYYDIGLISFVKKHQDKEWDMRGLTSNRNISLSDIEKYAFDENWELNYMKKISNDVEKFKKEHPLVWRDCQNIPNMEQFSKNIEKCSEHKWTAISRNPNITLEYVEQYMDKPWDWDGLSNNPSVTLENIEKHMDKPWDWYYYLSKNPIVTEEFVKKHIDKHWNWNSLVHNPNISLKLLTTQYFCEWHMFSSPNLTMDYVNNYAKKYGDENGDDGSESDTDYALDWRAWDIILSNPGIKLNDLNTYIKKNKYSGCYMSKNPNINISFVKKHYKNLKMEYISRNPGIFIEDIEDNIEYKWNWSQVSRNINITLDFVKEHMDNVEWEWYRLSMNPGIIINDAANNPKYEWNYYYLSINPNLTLAFIDDNIDEEWNWKDISNNPFTYERKMACKKKYKELGLSDDITNIILKYMPVTKLPDDYYED